MRSPGHWFARWYAEQRITARRARLASEISQVLDASVALELSGGGGIDSIYFAVAAGRRLGVVRLVNLFKRRPIHRRRPVGPHYLWRVLAADRRLEREWDVYGRLCSAMLAPAPLWRTHDAILCTYFDGQPVSSKMVSRPDRFWNLSEMAFGGLRRVHDHGVAHVDAKVENILTDEQGRQTVFIDFDCTPPSWIDFPQQKAYDYLKLTDSMLKLMPRRDRSVRLRLVDLLDRVVDDETRHASLDLVRQRPQTTRHVMRDGDLCRALRAVFRRL